MTTQRPKTKEEIREDLWRKLHESSGNSVLLEDGIHVIWENEEYFRQDSRGPIPRRYPRSRSWARKQIAARAEELFFQTQHIR